MTEQIEALPEEITVDDKDDIEAARAAYEALTDDQKALVDDETLAALTDAEDALAAAEVTEMINELPTDITFDNMNDVINASAAYEALTDSQKAMVDADSVKKLVTAANAAVKILVDMKEAEKVENLINALPEKITTSDKDDIEAARAAYEALTDDQKALVDEDVLKKLTDAEEALEKTDADQEAADAVVEQIEALPDVILLEDKADVEAARAAYDALTDDQKALVTNLDKLTEAEKMIADREAVKAVVDMINALPEDITLDDKADVAEAREALNNLTTDQTNIFPMSAIDKLFKAEDKIRDLEAADAVTEQINALPEEITIENKDDVEAARAAYDALTDDQKALVDEKTLEKLTDAEDALNSLVLLGDVDGDGEVSGFDVTWILRMTADMSISIPINEKAADVDGDGEITVFDATLIQRYLAEMTVNYPINEYV